MKPSEDLVARVRPLVLLLASSQNDEQLIITNTMTNELWTKNIPVLIYKYATGTIIYNMTYNQQSTCAQEGMVSISAWSQE